MSEPEIAPMVPNHHAHYGDFSGGAGLVAALSMTVGRNRNARLAARLSGLGRGDIALDVGCGPGAGVRHAARIGATVTGVDPAPVMLRIARLLTRPRRTVRYVEGTAEALPVDDNSATVVWSIQCVHHWADLNQGLREVRRVLRPGGRFVVIERRTTPGARGHASHGWTEAQAVAFAERCREQGFEGVRVDDDSAGKGSSLSVTATAPSA